MKVLLSWLQEFAPGIEGDPVELGEKLSALGLAVEEMTITGQGLEGIVLAKVLDLSPHPDADKIQLVQVDQGDGEACLLYTSPSPRDQRGSRMPSSA